MASPQAAFAPPPGSSPGRWSPKLAGFCPEACFDQLGVDHGQGIFLAGRSLTSNEKNVGAVQHVVIRQMRHSELDASR